MQIKSVKQISKKINKNKGEQKSSLRKNAFQLAKKVKQFVKVLQLCGNKWSEIISRYCVLIIQGYFLRNYQMKRNLHIDFFSSPNNKFIGFSEIKQPKEDVNNEQEEEQGDEKRGVRKSSFSFMYEPIMPFGQDFFEQKLQECNQPSSNNDQQQYEIIQEEDSLLKSPIIPENLLDPRPKFSAFDRNKKIIQQKIPDMFCDFEQNKAFLQEKVVVSNLQELFMTPKRKLEFSNSKRFTQSTAQKSISRTNEKGLRRLSTLAYSIVSQSSATTYKQVAQKLLSRLNFDCSELDDEQCRAQKSSMQNVKRRVYDSLNVLIALGVITRVGNKISRQKEKKNLLSGQFSDLQKYNDLLNQYKKKLINLELKRKTQRQLKQKLSIFKKTVERNKKTKLISKSKLIRLPFLVFATKQNNRQDSISKNINWMVKKGQQIDSQVQKKKVGSKRGVNVAQTVMVEKQGSQKHNADDTVVQIRLKGFPQCYGDLDFFKLIEKESCMANNQRFKDQWQGERDVVADRGFQMTQKAQEHDPDLKLISHHDNHQQHLMSLIDEVLDY